MPDCYYRSMSNRYSCQNCASEFNLNNHYNCPKCGVRGVLTSSGAGSAVDKETKRTESYANAVIIGFAILVIFWIGVALVGIAQPEGSSGSGQTSEWTQDNSVDGPTGTFDDQSKP